MQITRIPRLGWLGMALVTTCVALALIGALFLRPPTANAAGPAVKTPPLTGSPSIARPNNHYNNKLVAEKLARLHKLVRPLINYSYLTARSWPVVFVHGFNGNASINCTSGYWGTATSFLHNTYGWTGNLYTVGYYKGDSSCSASLGNYAGYCTNEYAGNQGTTNEDIRHISCELAWYLWYNFTQYDENVQLVGHSMGGLIIRWALYDTPIDYYLPPYLMVQDAVSIATPHGGIPIFGASIFICGGCLQAQQMRSNNGFITTLGSYGQNPQGAGWGTDWTMFGSSCESWYNIFDPGVDWQSSLDMNGGHKTEYLNPPCYDHGGYLKDTSTSWNAYANWCDYCNADVVSNHATDWPHSLQNLGFSLEYSEW
jgi:pimeloyl-ACP methyl ester carboxylesterase